MSSILESISVPSGQPLIALTGATGFIGQHLLHELPKRGYRLRVLLRRPTVVPLESSAVIDDLARPQNMSAAIADVDAVIYSAGLAHVMSGLPEDDYRTLNTEATIALARAAQRAGARRFVFLSSIRAQSGPSADHVLTEELTPQPTDAYGRSKLAAEQGPAELAIDWVALRLVLVYGAGERQRGRAGGGRWTSALIHMQDSSQIYSEGVKSGLMRCSIPHLTR